MNEIDPRCLIFRDRILKGKQRAEFSRLLPANHRRETDARMAWKRKISGGTLATVGYLLSPLSWWNDAFVNIPLALVFAWLVSLFYKPAFTASLIVGYWLTNVLGLVLLHKGARQVFSEKPPPDPHRELWTDVVVSLIYTVIIITLIRLEILKPMAAYFKGD